MGREIRRVPPNWQHPKETKWNQFKGKSVEGYRPMFDRNFLVALDEYYKDLKLWSKNEHPTQLEHKIKIDSGYRYDHEELDKPDYYFAPDYQYWDYAGDPPTSQDSHLFTDEEATWYQVYETVSEGTPVTPPFETQEELIQYLAANGDFWDQQRRADGDTIMDNRPWGEENARKFVMGSGSMPSMVITDGKIITGGELAGEMNGTVQS